MNTENNRSIDDLIVNVLEDNVPADVDRRLHSQLEDFRHRLGEANTPAVHRLTALSRLAWFGISAAAVAMIGVAALIEWSLLPGESLAAVAAAVLSQPWIHVTQAMSNGETNELWYSPSKDISAWHEKDWIEYRDHRLQIYYAYDLHDKVLYRVPEEIRRGTESFASVIASLRVLLQDNQPADKPLERLGIPEKERSHMEVSKQKLEKIKLDGRDWLDYHLTLTSRDEIQPEPVQMQILFRVDPETKLLQLARYETLWKGRHIITEGHVDYPEQGPADVYDMGVPKTSKIVDRVPTNELSRILKTIRAGRERMDDYRAVLVRRMEGSWRPSGFPEVIYRKGNNFRRDTAIWIDPSIMSDPKIQWPKADEDGIDWWKKCIKDHCFILPMSIDHGATAYKIKTRCVTDPDGSVNWEITGVEKHESNSKPGETYPGLWSWMPEFACRPPLGIPSETMEPVLEQNPKEGPAGTILLHVRNLARIPQPPSPDLPKLPPQPDAYRSWLDPTRDYAIVRSDMIGNDGSGKEEVHSTIIDTMARSPQGTWYATQIRNKGAIGSPSDGKTYDEIIDLYVDFNVNLPDSLFQPPAPGRIH